MELFNFEEVRGYANFMLGAQNVLIKTLSDFLSATVELDFKLLSHCNYDIKSYPHCNVYKMQVNKILLVTHAKVLDKRSYILGITIESNSVGFIKHNKIFNVLAASVSNALTESYTTAFRNSIILLNENLVKQTIAKFVSRGSYNPYKIYHTIEHFINLRSTTFEGKYFSSGLIVTKSLYKYKESIEKNSTALLYLYKNGLFDKMGTRYWYMADGYTTFYLSDLKKDIHYMFVHIDNNPNYVDRMMLKKALHGKDLLFRIDNGRELSVITSDGIEFIHQENVWRYRDYDLLHKLIDTEIKMDNNIYDAILYYVLYCSKHDISSIIWIPKEFDKAKDMLKTSHSFSNKIFNVKDRNYEGLIKRLLSSDGATVITKDGEVRYYGCIVEMNNVDGKKPKGTGETAASMLASNGIAFKISQDGTIKIFLNDKRNGTISF